MDKLETRRLAFAMTLAGIPVFAAIILPYALQKLQPVISSTLENYPWIPEFVFTTSFFVILTIFFYVISFCYVQVDAGGDGR